ncbi:peptidase C14 [Anopheles sinensis]|uniref:Peptidase C14 n=1 Tax=Anopheles sinensis TaxID=74873 RepID=A0A084VWN9_ANOSI|nr:peptidase C14 [Anopheles sinensis]
MGLLLCGPLGALVPTIDRPVENFPHQRAFPGCVGEGKDFRAGFSEPGSVCTITKVWRSHRSGMSLGTTVDTRGSNFSQTSSTALTSLILGNHR